MIERFFKENTASMFRVEVDLPAYTVVDTIYCKPL